MKGVIASLAPRARILDIAHDVGPGDVRGAALALEAAARFFPPATVHVAVVDPGVGTSRRAVVVEAAGQVFVGPDNGLLSLAARPPRRVFALDRAQHHLGDVSATFHGRDIFAPVAAKLATGVASRSLGSRADDLVELVLPAVSIARRSVSGVVIHVDRFGNLMTSITAADLRSIAGSRAHGSVVVEVGRRKLSGGLARTYGERPPGTLLALIGSSGRLEIACRDGSAASLLGYRASRALAVRCVVADRD